MRKKRRSLLVVVDGNRPYLVLRHCLIAMTRLDDRLIMALFAIAYKVLVYCGLVREAYCGVRSPQNSASPAMRLTSDLARMRIYSECRIKCTPARNSKSCAARANIARTLARCLWKAKICTNNFLHSTSDSYGFQPPRARISSNRCELRRQW